MIRHIAVHSVLRQSVSTRYDDLVTRPTGRVVRESIERALAEDDAVALIDFTGVGCIDYSCADEIVAKLLRARIRVLVLRGLTEGHRQAIEPVLEGHGLAAAHARADGSLDVLGPAEAAAALAAELVERHLAERTPGGTLALVAA